MSDKSKKQAPVEAGQTVGEAFATILGHNLEYLTEWQDSARSWKDTEGVHQLRVALRRMRSALRLFRPAVPPPAAERWAEEMGWLAGQLGPARDLDVFIDEGLNAVADKLPLSGGKKLTALTEQRREQAYGAVQAMLDSARYAEFQEGFRAWLDQRGWLEEKSLSDKNRRVLDSNVVDFARQRLDKQERRVVDAGAEVDRDSPKAMHQLRIKCKRLRYAAEFFAPLFAGMDEFIDPLKALQDLLGVMNDVSVMHHLLDDLLADERDHELLQYAGALVGWRTHQSYDMKNSFDERWQHLVDAPHPWREEPAENR